MYFYRYDRNVQHKQPEVKLKPDMLGLPPPKLDEGRRFCVAWEDVLIVGECKFDDFGGLIHQTASYARAVFSHQRDRLWVYCIMLSRPNTAIIARYDRSGLIMTPEYDVSRQDGRFNITMGLCALMTLDDVRFGIDGTISRDNIVIGSIEFHIVETLCYRECVRGRGTRVYVLEPVSRDPPNAISTAKTTAIKAAITSPPVFRRSVRLKEKGEKGQVADEAPETVRYCRL
jgi:hypothetical protein